MIAKTLLVSALLVCVTGAAASAADLPARYAPPAYMPPTAPLFTWTGLYAGGTLGGVVDNRSSYALAGVLPANQLVANSYARGTYPSGHQGGFTGGGQVGANYQLRGGFVIGLEADAAYTDLDHTQDDPVPAGAGRVFQTRLNFLGTVRGRVGYAFDRLLLYGTGGFAYGQTDSNVALRNVANTITRFSGSGSELQTGFAVGGGVEYALPSGVFFAGLTSQAVTLKVEYLHYDLGNTNITANSIPAVGTVGAYNARLAVSGDLVRAGLNIKFGEPVAVPVVARY